ncbi:energy-coupling factor transporter transmembrane component T [Myceligenerans crystallogenes]|uniref:Energy-coupling factor transport system permease protein n=1 Tax=Myceligenerans crystallogenes TaxID=316335 RepID=A0ABN2NLL8_9MICO
MTATSPYARVERPRLLQRANPLAVAAAVAPGIVVAFTAPGPATPCALLVLATLAVAAGVRVPTRHRVLVFAGPVLFTLFASLTLGLWTPADDVAGTPLLLAAGPFEYRLGTWLAGLAISLRLGAVLALALVPGVASTGPDVVRAAVQNLRVPYRIGYTALASFRFVPRFSRELAQIRAAHRVRGTARGRGPLAAIRRGTGYLVPLLAGALRHAERVALAMDARAFGAHPARTERILLPFRGGDIVLVAVTWALIAAALWLPLSVPDVRPA